MKTRNGQVAWLSARTQRIFKNFEDALTDAESYLKNYDEQHASKKYAFNDIYVVHLWLNYK